MKRILIGIMLALCLLEAGCQYQLPQWRYGCTWRAYDGLWCDDLFAPEPRGPFPKRIETRAS